MAGGIGDAAWCRRLRSWLLLAAVFVGGIKDGLSLQVATGVRFAHHGALIPNAPLSAPQAASLRDVHWQGIRSYGVL
jgi:hypothetical protein